MLSQFEQRELQKIENWFREVDPRFEKALAAGEPPPTGLPARVGRAAADVLAAALLVLGLVTANVMLVLLGSAGLAVAAWLHMRV